MATLAVVRQINYLTTILASPDNGGWGYSGGTFADNRYLGFGLPSTGDHIGDSIYGLEAGVNVGGIGTIHVGHDLAGNWDIVLDGAYATFPTNYTWSDTYEHTGTPSGQQLINAAQVSTWTKVDLTSPNRTRWSKNEAWGGYADATNYSPTITVIASASSTLTVAITDGLTSGITI